MPSILKPFHLVKDRATDASAGSHTSQMTSSVGTPTIAMTTIRSRVPYRFSTRRVEHTSCLHGAVAIAMGFPSLSSDQPRMDVACCWMDAGRLASCRWGS